MGGSTLMTIWSPHATGLPQSGSLSWEGLWLLLSTSEQRNMVTLRRGGLKRGHRVRGGWLRLVSCDVSPNAFEHGDFCMICMIRWENWWSFSFCIEHYDMIYKCTWMHLFMWFLWVSFMIMMMPIWCIWNMYAWLYDDAWCHLFLICDDWCATLERY